MIVRRLESIYAGAVRARNAAYDRGVARVRRVAGLRVISVGGITIGGDGKTPMAMHVARLVASSGATTAVVARGYRGALARRGGVVSEGSNLLATVAESGDEPMLAARRLDGVAVVVGADRVEAAERARALGARVVVLDSGFQHRRLFRDLDIVIAPPSEDGGALLPRGRLREPLSALARADLLARRGDSEQGEAPVPTCTFETEAGALVDHELAIVGRAHDLAGQKALLVSGIARPEAFEKTVVGLGAESRGHLAFPDHHRFRSRDRERIVDAARRAGASVVVTTEKDVLRLGAVNPLQVVAVRLELSITSGRARLERMVRAAAGLD